MSNIIVAVLQILFLLWLTERVIGKPTIKPVLHYGKLAVQGIAWMLTTVISAAVGLTGFIVRHTPAAIAWARSLRR